MLIASSTGKPTRTLLYKKEAQALPIRHSGLAQPLSPMVRPAHIAQPLGDSYRASR